MNKIDGPFTWKQLADIINQMTDEQKNTDVTVYTPEIDKYYQVTSLGITDETDTLDENHPFLEF